MARLVTWLGVLSTTFVDLSLCACGTNDHPTVPPPPVDAGIQDSGDAGTPNSNDAGGPEGGADADDIVQER